MGKTLVLAEKPSVGKEIARVLGCHGGGSGYMAGAQYVVTWALGHLVELAEPEHYGSQYKTWSLDSLPMMPGKDGPQGDPGNRQAVRRGKNLAAQQGNRLPGHRH